MTHLYDIPVTALDGSTTSFDTYRGQVLLVVNVASKCAFTPQYAALQQLHERYSDRGFSVLGFPCNQFLFQEPGDADQIGSFCSTNYGVTFPLFAKTKVRGRSQHPVYTELTRTPDSSGKAGNVKWNFEKFLVSRDGTPLRRFRSKVSPDSPEVTEAIEKALSE